MADTGTVLVTGGAGYIGSHAVLALKDAGYRVAVIDNLSTGFRFAVPDGVPLIEGDIADAGLLARTFDEHRVGAVMHFAGSIIVPESVTNPLKYYRNNTAASRTLIEAAVTGGVKHFIFSSTAAVYGMPEVSPIGEATPQVPINPYGTSKLMTEWMLRDVAAVASDELRRAALFQRRRGRSARAQRPVDRRRYPPDQGRVRSGDRQARPRDRLRHRLPDRRRHRRARLYPCPRSRRRARRAAGQAGGGEPMQSLTMNCGYSRGFSVLEVLDAVDRVTNMKIERVMAPRRAGDPPALVADNTRILQTLDWKPVRDDLDLIIADALAWERQLDLKRPAA